MRGVAGTASGLTVLSLAGGIRTITHRCFEGAQLLLPFEASRGGAGAPPSAPGDEYVTRDVASNDQSERSLRKKRDEEALKIFMLSDYPVPLSHGERGSASAERIRDAAFALHEAGHEVVLITPSYAGRPELTSDVPFPVRTVLFRPQHLDIWQKSGPYLGFDYPVLDRNLDLKSRTLLSQMSLEDFDRMLMGCLAVFRLTSLTFGEPDAVITSHAASMWNYVAANYPIRAFTSESDAIPESTKDTIRDIIVSGARSVGGFIAFSKFASTNLASNFGITDEGRIKIINRGIDMGLFNSDTSLTKMDLMGLYSSELAGLSPDKRWVTLFDQSNDPDASAYLRNVAYEIAHDRPEIAVIIIDRRGQARDAVGGGTVKALGPVRGNIHTIMLTDRRDQRRLMSVADAGVIYVGTEAPPRAMDRTERNLKFASLTAVMLRDEQGRRFTFPGRVDPFETEVLEEARRDLRDYFTELSHKKRRNVLHYLERIQQERAWIEPRSSNGWTGLRHAKGAVIGAADLVAVRRLALAAGEGLVDAKLRVIIPDESKPQQSLLPSDGSIARQLEQILYDAVKQDPRQVAGLTYQGSRHSAARQERLDEIIPHPDVKRLWRRLVRDIEQGLPVAEAFREWQDWALRAIYTSEFRNPADAEAIPSVRRNPNGVLSTMARLSGVTTEVLFEKLRVVAATPWQELVRIDLEDRVSEPPPEPAGGAQRSRGQLVPLRKAFGRGNG